MSQDNPYSFTDVAGDSHSYGGPGEAVSQRIIDDLQKTRPWVRLFGILLIIGVVFASIAVALILWGSLTRGAAGTTAPLAAMVVTVILYFFPAKHLLGYANAIAALSRSRAQQDLEIAIAKQRAFWRFVGILTALILLIYLFLFIMGFFFAAVWVGTRV